MSLRKRVKSEWKYLGRSDVCEHDELRATEWLSGNQRWRQLRSGYPGQGSGRERENCRRNYRYGSVRISVMRDWATVGWIEDADTIRIRSTQQNFAPRVDGRLTEEVARRCLSSDL